MDQWYRENKSLRREATTLKRQSAVLMQRVAESAPPDFDLSLLANVTEAADKDMQLLHEKEVATLHDKIKGQWVSVTTICQTSTVGNCTVPIYTVQGKGFTGESN